MVVFTCNNCGESLQKPKVEKHYFTACRKAPKSLTCVDCFKDFKGEEYATHVKCVTEEERYAAKGSFPKGIVKKGDVKQESWTEIIKSVIDSATNVKASQQQIYTIMSSSANVPRKKNKFINFIKSSSGNKASSKDAEEIWDIIEKYKASQQQEKGPVKLENDDENKDNENIQDAAVEEPPKKKKKKSKSVEHENNEGQENSTEPVNNDATVEVSKSKMKKSKNVEEKTNVENDLNESETVSEGKKKRKKKNVDHENETTTRKSNEEVNNVTPVTNGESVEKSKKKKKKLENLNESTEVKSEVLNTEQTPTADKLEKKKRKSKDVEENEINGESPKANVDDNVESSKKKKRKTGNTAENGQLQNDCNQVNTIESKKRKLNESKNVESEIPKDELNQDEHQKQQDSDKSSAFSFKEEILAIMTSKKNISIDKLQKKVLNTYQKVTGKEPDAKVVRKFKKHLKKISNVEVTDASVKLIEC